ncbi:family 5 glycoside hydrolase [Phakopsora pachyrhizi]|uniref:cellulase n=1 Tax=Phakopsora pachyrhizi TaxID=170000 RepID=A0AAV0B576_PHAPC|nr:family 5 glycoside hydrolase [Phakopsora pachyrhizi]
MNLAGLDFGAVNDGSYIIGNAVTPPVNQIPHFTKQGANVIRVNFAWPYIQSKLNGELNKTSLDNLRGIVDAVLENGAYAILDLHSYARFDRKIVGESDIKAEALVDVWRRLAKSFPQKDVLYGITNEPHDLKMETWADTMKTIVTELRKDGVTNIILIPGNEFTSLQAFPKWYPFLKDITNPDGSTDNLIFEAHRYLDVDNSGTHTECTASNVADVEEALKILQKDGRQLILAETGEIRVDLHSKPLNPQNPIQ